MARLRVGSTWIFPPRHLRFLQQIFMQVSKGMPNAKTTSDISSETFQFKNFISDGSFYIYPIDEKQKRKKVKTDNSFCKD